MLASIIRKVSRSRSHEKVRVLLQYRDGSPHEDRQQDEESRCTCAKPVREQNLIPDPPQELNVPAVLQLVMGQMPSPRPATVDSVCPDVRDALCSLPGPRAARLPARL